MKSTQINPESVMAKPQRRGAFGAWSLVVLFVCILFVFLPLAGDSGFSRLGLFAETCVVAVAVGTLAAALAVPVAWAAAQAAGARARGLAFAAMLLPLLQPGYLWYAGLSAARGPGTWLGGLLERGPQWVNIACGQGLAIVGVAVHLMPVAGVVLASGFAALPRGTLDVLRLESAGPLVRWWVVARLSGRELLGAAGLCGLVAFGSAVPLHLAQVNTYSIALWRMMDLAEVGKQAGVVWAALPVGALAVSAAWGLSGRLLAAPDAADAGADTRAMGVGGLAGCAATVVGFGAVLLPLGLLGASLREAGVVAQFWRDSRQAVWDSVQVAAAVGCVCVALGGLVWFLLAGEPREGARVGGGRVLLARGMVLIGLAGALLPGALVGWLIRMGSAWVGGLGGFGSWIDDVLTTTPGGLVLGHVARFGGLAMVVGALAARAEPEGLRALRASEGAAGLGAWWRLCARPGWKTLAGIGLATAAMSMFEIEAGVMLQAPGTRSLARTLLEHLHTLRDQQLAAGAVLLVSAGLVVALWAAWLVGPVLRGRGEA